MADDFISFNLTSNPAVITFGGQVLPCIALICDGCGYTILVNAVKLGLIKGLNAPTDKPDRADRPIPQ